MDEETVRKMDGVVLARSGLRGATDRRWTDEDKKRYKIELEKLPGEYRVYDAWEAALLSERNQKNAETYGIDVQTYLRLCVTGNQEMMRHFNRPESAPSGGFVPGTPGNLYGVAIRDTCLTPS